MPTDAEHLVACVVTAHHVDHARPDTEVIGNQLADGDVGLVVDGGGHDSDDEPAVATFAHLVPSGTRDHPHLDTLLASTHRRRRYVLLAGAGGSSGLWRAVAASRVERKRLPNTATRMARIPAGSATSRPHVQFDQVVGRM